LRIEEVAVSRKEGEATLRVPRIGSRLVVGRSTIEAEVLEKDQTGQLGILVRTIDLDALRQAGMLGPVGFMKIDVEGHEHEVLYGAKRLLARDRPNLVLEAEQRHHKFPLADIFGLLAKADYVGSFIDANFVFVPAERADSIRASLQERLRQRLA
jgi:FkbM family methyltransferase